MIALIRADTVFPSLNCFVENIARCAVAIAAFERNARSFDSFGYASLRSR